MKQNPVNSSPNSPPNPFKMDDENEASLDDLLSISLAKSDLEQLVCKCASFEQFNGLVTDCFVRVNIQGHAMISSIRSAICTKQSEELRLHLGQFGQIPLAESLEELPETEEFIPVVRDSKKFKFDLPSAEKIAKKVQQIRQVLGQGWRQTVNIPDSTSFDIENELLELGGPDGGQGELFRILVHRQELLELLQLGADAFQSIAVGLFVQIRLDHVPSPLLSTFRHFVAQIAEVIWPHDVNMAPGDVLLHFQHIGTVPINFVEEGPANSAFVRQCLSIMLQMNVPLPKIDFILVKQAQLRAALEQLQLQLLQKQQNVQQLSPFAFTSSSTVPSNSCPSQLPLQFVSVPQICPAGSNRLQELTISTSSSWSHPEHQSHVPSSTTSQEVLALRCPNCRISLRLKCAEDGQLPPNGTWTECRRCGHEFAFNPNQLIGQRAQQFIGQQMQFHQMPLAPTTSPNPAVFRVPMPTTLPGMKAYNRSAETAEMSRPSTAPTCWERKGAIASPFYAGNQGNYGQERRATYENIPTQVQHVQPPLKMDIEEELEDLIEPISSSGSSAGENLLSDRMEGEEALIIRANVKKEVEAVQELEEGEFEEQEGMAEQADEQERLSRMAFVHLHKAFSPTAVPLELGISSPYFSVIGQHLREMNNNNIRMEEQRKKDNWFKEAETSSSSSGQQRELVEYNDIFSSEDVLNPSQPNSLSERGNWSAQQVGAVSGEQHRRLPTITKGRKRNAVDYGLDETVEVVHGQQQQRPSIFERIQTDPDGEERLARGVLKSRRIRKVGGIHERISFDSGMAATASNSRLSNRLAVLPPVPVNSPSSSSTDFAVLMAIRCPACKVLLRTEQVPRHGTRVECRHCGHSFGFNRNQLVLPEWEE